MTLSLADLIVLMLPGFWSMWVFKRVSSDNLDKKPGWILFFLGLTFGLLNLVIFLLLSTFSDWFIPGVFSQGEETGIFAPEFWESYAILSVLSLISGGVAGILRETKFFGRARIWPVYWFAWIAGKVTGSPAGTGIQDSLTFLARERFSKSTILRLRSLHADDPGIVGVYGGGSWDEDMILEATHLFSPELFPYGKPFSTCILLEKGIILEYLTADIKEQKALKENFCVRYKNLTEKSD